MLDLVNNYKRYFVYKETDLSEEDEKLTRQEKKERNIQRILDAAAHLYAEFGFESVSNREVAEFANVSVATVNRLFPGGKEALFKILNED